ncbi:zinc ribbon domain-containing protein [Okeania sp. SIO2B3]|uniref:zinc ribbon domain-containing protein n=1 Tax=Okeania sp. SIO2B3 TaxID=2607784 RepID=UPI0025F34271|nr:zinc ribbon domain-containing protein [Okeania sp. SIO2B3]
MVDRWFPSSKTCSRCGTVKESLLLSERVFNCEHCNLSCDRDLNAALNLAMAGSLLRNASAFRASVALRQFCEAKANVRVSLWTGQRRRCQIEARIEQIIIDLYRLS